MAKLEKKQETGLEIYAAGDILSRINIPESQREVASQTAGQLVSIDLSASAIEKELKKLKLELQADPDPRVRRLKQLKADLKRLNVGKEQLISSMNGIMKMALADVPGKTLADKYKQIGVGGIS